MLRSRCPTRGRKPRFCPQPGHGWTPTFKVPDPTPAGFGLPPGAVTLRRMVWKYLLEIPYGELTTYGKLARQVAAALGRPHISAQAVGRGRGAQSHFPILIPCHRVVGADGSLTGYAGGLDTKAVASALGGR